MTTIQVETQLSLKTLLQGLTQLSLDELQAVSRQASLLRARHFAPSLPKEEAQLLLKINQGVIPEKTTVVQCATLSEKSRQGSITDEEQTQLNGLVDEIELLNAERIGYLVKLAQLRQTTLPALMDELEIKPFSYA